MQHKMTVDVNGITINYIKKGQGTPLILVHGNGEDYHIFDQLIEKLKHKHTIYAIDTRNHGESSKTEDFSYETMAEDIYQFIRKLGLEHVSLVGFSDGAILGILLAIEHAMLFEKMVLLGVNLSPTDFKQDIYKELEQGYRETKDPLLKMMLEQPNIALDKLRDILTPTLVVAAEDDLFYKHTFDNIVEAMPHAKLKIMQGHDHGSYIIHQDILYPDLMAFLSLS